MQEKTKLDLQGKEIARNINCEEWSLQEIKFARKPSYK